VRADADPLAGKPLYSTVPLAVTGGTSTVVDAPRALTPAVGTTGPVPVGLFLVGYTLEQALVIDLEGKGLVLIVGCGHPGVEAIVRRAEQVYRRSVYVVVGGLHFPVTQDRAQLGPLRGQNLFGSPTPPWRPIGEADVHGAIAFLRGRGVAVVGVSPHDSCDWSLTAFASAFGAGYRPVRVGEPIGL
jgi:7,8-dihydropterin-6-yl-methyl-4-(beta-D-ribofuranosyl)aminobenzene 5'-phosphate synthase